MIKHDGKNWVFSSGQQRYGYSENLSVTFDEKGNPSISFGYDGNFWNKQCSKCKKVQPYYDI